MNVPPLTADQWDRVMSNQGLIRHVIDEMAVVRPDETDDAWQDGFFGLCRAAQLYDPTKARFSTYACKWIHQAIQRGRGTVEGVNYRRAAKWNHGNGDYTPPVSLDATGDTDDPLGTLTADPDVDVERDVINRHTLNTARARAAQHCVDDLDRDIAGTMFGVHHATHRQLARRHRVSFTTIERRKRLLVQACEEPA